MGMKTLKSIISNIITEELNRIIGGNADGMSVEDIAKKHKVSPASIRLQIEKGKKVEMEHTKDSKLAREIAMDHLEEIPDYYTRLEKMEKEAKRKFEKKNK